MAESDISEELIWRAQNIYEMRQGRSHWSKEKKNMALFGPTGESGHPKD